MTRPGGEPPIVDAEFEEVAPPAAAARPRARARKAAPDAPRVEARPVREPDPPAPAEGAFTPEMPRSVNLTATLRPSGRLAAFVEALPVSLHVPLPSVTPTARAGLLFALGALGGLAANALRKPAPPARPLPRTDDGDDDAE